MPDWAGVLDVWTWTYYSAETIFSTQEGTRMQQNTHFEAQKLNISGEPAPPQIPPAILSTWPPPNQNPGSAHTWGMGKCTAER